MSLANSTTVDAIGIDRTSGAAILTIADSWNWADENSHLLALQEKINTYFAFIESGEVFASYPKAANRKMIIEIVGRYPLPESARLFLRRASECAKQLQVEVRFRRVEHVE
jgi:hypothetical protein